MGLRRALLVASCLVIMAPAVQAAPTAREEGKARFERAIRFFEDGQYEVALVEFRASMAAYKSRAAALDIAICLRKLGRYDEELEVLDEVKRDFPPTNKSETAEIETARKEALDRVALVTVTVTERDATVRVDGRERGKSPLEPLRISAGARRISVEKEGYRTFETTLDLPARVEKTVAVTLVPVETHAVAPSAPPPPLPPPPPAKRSAPLWPAFVIGGAGVAAAGVGLAFLGLRAGTVSDGKAQCQPGLTDVTVFSRCQTLEDRAKTQGTVATALLITGGALVVGAGIYALVRPRAPAPKLACAPGPLAIACAARF